ncbi:immunoglobulin lambda-1 light chain-like isoform X2 [Melanotaenia boesemani]|uniref:immunoglobulin lambda-1 light chain-like isoform X2 n=1 Tax=Melanotaenia boesemani TaxID=1250792 RepID=UPI001C0533E9|nr:immunoglobulin lambda-1 light chain-like isoform X2 [Melanotaenia boesemani]
MLWTLCTLITALTYVDAAKLVTQTPAVNSVSTGQEVVLNCNIEKPENFYVHWYKQLPGGTPQYILRFYHEHSSPSFGAGFSSDRFNSKSTSNIDYQLVIKQAETADSAVYFCCTWDDSAKENVFGQGTKLIVTSSSLSAPVLTVFPPSSSELQSSKVTLVCLSSQSGPFSDVSWLLAGSPVSSGISTSTAVQRPDQTFQISSSLTIQTSDWNMNKVYTCKVSLGSQTAEKTINKSECPADE